MATNITFAVIHDHIPHVFSGEKGDGETSIAAIDRILAAQGLELDNRDILVPLKMSERTIRIINGERAVELYPVIVPVGAISEEQFGIMQGRIVQYTQVLESALSSFKEALRTGEDLELRHQQLSAAKQALKEELKRTKSATAGNDYFDDAVTLIGECDDAKIYSEAPKAYSLEHDSSNERGYENALNAVGRYNKVKTYYTTGPGCFASEMHKRAEISKCIAEIKFYYGKARAHDNGLRLTHVFTDGNAGLLSEYYVDLHVCGKPFTREEFSHRVTRYLLNDKPYHDKDSRAEFAGIEARAVFSTKQSSELDRIIKLKQKLKSAADRDPNYAKLLTLGLGYLAMGPAIVGRALIYGRDRTFEEIIEIANGKDGGDWFPSFPSRGGLSEEEKGYLIALLESEDTSAQFEEGRSQAAIKLAIASDVRAKALLESHAGGRKSILDRCTDIKKIDPSSQRGASALDRAIGARNAGLVELSIIAEAMLEGVFPHLELLGRIHFDIYPPRLLSSLPTPLRAAFDRGKIYSNFQLLQERIQGAQFFGDDGLYQALKKVIELNQNYLEAAGNSAAAKAQVYEDYVAMLALLPTYSSNTTNSAGDRSTHTQEYPEFERMIKGLVQLRRDLEAKIATLTPGAHDLHAGKFKRVLLQLRETRGLNATTVGQIDTLLDLLNQGTRILVPNAARRAEYYAKINVTLEAFRVAVGGGAGGVHQAEFRAVAEDLHNMVPTEHYDASGVMIGRHRGEPRA